MATKIYSRQELIEHATLTNDDIEQIKLCRRHHNCLGFAYQIGFVRLKNRFPIQQPFEIIPELATYIGVQLKIEPDEIQKYTSRQQTISEHQLRICQYLNLEELAYTDTESLKQYIFEQSCRLEQTGALRILIEQYLREHKIVQPADSTLLRMVGEQRRSARRHIYEKITNSLSNETKQKLDELVTVDETPFSLLHQFKAVPKSPSPTAMLELTQKLEQIASIGVLDVDLSWLNNNYQRALTNYVQRSSAHTLRDRIIPPHRYAAVTCFLWQTYQDTVDQIVDMYDKLLNKVYNWAQDDLDEIIKRQRRSIQRVLAMFSTVGEVLLDQAISDDSIRKTLFNKFPQEELAERIGQSKEWTTGKSSHIFYGVMQRFGYMRQFSKSFLENLGFGSSQKETSQLKLISLLDAIETLKEMNQSGKRKLPPDAPMSFVPTKFKSFIESDGELNKSAWECTLLTVLRDEIRSGNLSVAHSKRFGNFNDFFIHTDQWQKMRESFFRAANLPSNPREASNYLTERLNRAYDSFLESQPANTYVKVNKDGWQLSADTTEKLDSQEEEKLERLKNWLQKQMRSIRLPELLIEVDNELRYTHHFLHTNYKEKRSVLDICSTLATIIAYGCNVGPYTMSRMVNGISYSQIQRITDWQLTEDNQRSALASVVNAIARLDTSQIWGQGKTSASDGQRYSFRRRVLHQTFSHKFSDFALEFYSFIADNYAPFYGMPIECTDRDAPFVLDGLLYNESDLELEEHYTDTHGYTENNFAAFAMLGRRFCPRIRSVNHQRIYRIDPLKDYGVLKPLINRRDRTIKMDWVMDQWDRMGQFYATLKTGHTTANVALKRLNSMSPKNEFYRANRELGRIFKTEFILGVFAHPPMCINLRNKGIKKGKNSFGIL